MLLPISHILFLVFFVTACPLEGAASGVSVSAMIVVFTVKLVFLVPNAVSFGGCCYVR